MNPRNACIAASILFFSCSTPALSDRGLPVLGFTSPPAGVIAALADGEKGYAEHFMLGVAYKKESRLKDAMRHFANSCFRSHFDTKLRLFPQPVYQFVKGFHLKSPYYSDAVYELAELFSEYGEHAYVPKFIDLMPRSGGALYRDGQLVKARSLAALKKYDGSLAVLNRLLAAYGDPSSRSIIHLRIGSVLEKKLDPAGARKSYLSVIAENPRGWQSSSAAGLIQDIMKKGGSALDFGEGLLLARALYFSGRYGEAAALLGTLKPGPADRAETLSLLVRSLAHDNRVTGAEQIISGQSGDAALAAALTKACADELWDMGKKGNALPLYRKIIAAGAEPHVQDAMYRTARLMEERKMAGYEQALLQYKERYSDDHAGRFLWLLGRSMVRAGNMARAGEYLGESVKRFPDGSHSDECRFWLYKIYSAAGDKQRALKTARDIATINPDSPYTWLLMKQIADRESGAALADDYKKAVAGGDMDAALYLHLLLFIKEQSMQKRSARIGDLDAPVVRRYRELEDAVAGMKTSSSYGGTLKEIGKYFQVGYDAGIARELALLPGTAVARRDRHIALAHYSRQYPHAYQEVYSFLELLKLAELKENIALMPEGSVTALFPAPFKECVERYGRLYELEPNVIYSVMKAESLFNHRAVSSAGAAGLMQLMPATAKGLARGLKLENYDLTDPCTSVQFGAKYIAGLFRQFKGNFPYVVAAYNAGAGNVGKWIDKMKSDDMDYFTEFTPFIETRYYILRTGKFLTQYRLISGGQAPAPAD